MGVLEAGSPSPGAQRGEGLVGGLFWAADGRLFVASPRGEEQRGTASLVTLRRPRPHPQGRRPQGLVSPVLSPWGVGFDLGVLGRTHLVHDILLLHPPPTQIHVLLVCKAHSFLLQTPTCLNSFQHPLYSLQPKWHLHTTQIRHGWDSQWGSS